MKRRALPFALIGAFAVTAWLVGSAWSLTTDSSPSTVDEASETTSDEVLLASFETSTTCPNVSCLTERGYYECIGCAGCTCDPMTDYCVPEPPPPPPPTGCPNVSCLTQAGYEACVSCPGCGCHPQTDQCYETAVQSIGVGAE